MAFDGLVISNLVSELKNKLVGGRIMKISQPEKDELILTIKNYNQYKLFISADAGLPLIYLTSESKLSPLNAPNFCMLLRKHLSSARILEISQPSLERIIQIKIEHLNELGDVCIKYLIVEIMGKHSNIIFCNEDLTIVDSIKHVSGFVSSVREVLPGRTYFIPNTENKLNPLSTNQAEFNEHIFAKAMPINKAIYSTYTGISPLVANELCHRAGIDADIPANTLLEFSVGLYNEFEKLFKEVAEENFHPNIIFKGDMPVEFSSTFLSCYIGSSDPSISSTVFESVSVLLEEYYSTKNKLSVLKQKSTDLRKVINNALERTAKKYDLQHRQLTDTEKREKFKIYGELLTTYGYSAEPGADKITVLNYYTNEDITIPLDPTLTALENAKLYFEKYSRLKRTFEAQSKLIVETEEELRHLESISAAMDIAVKEEDLTAIRQELMEFGYVKARGFDLNAKKKQEKKQGVTSKPFHYISSDGYHIYVGKNNFQNDELTFKFATGNDWWFHAKGMAGSHVIVKSNGEELPDRVFEEAGSLAAYYSKGRDAEKVEIDYVEKKHVKKPGSSKPGFVVYYTNYSLMAIPDISKLTLIP